MFKNSYLKLSENEKKNLNSASNQEQKKPSLEVIKATVLFGPLQGVKKGQRQTWVFITIQAFRKANQFHS